MAKKVTIELVDDISGESGATTTQFGLDGIEYKIDLVNDKALREQFAPWIAKSRRVNGHGQNGSLPTNGRHRHDMHLIRVWAKQNNITVPARGRMPAAIIEAYDKAQSAK